MLDIGMPELIIILVIALIVFGPNKLPDVGKSLGRALSEFKKASDELNESSQEAEKPVNVQQIEDDKNRRGKKEKDRHA